MSYTGPEITLALFLAEGWEMTGEKDDLWKTLEFELEDLDTLPTHFYFVSGQLH